MAGNRLVMLAIGLSSFLAAADAESDQKDGDERLAAATRALGEACAADMGARYDWDSERGAHGKPAYQGAQYCKAAVDGLKSACSDATARLHVTTNIRGVKCRFDQGASKRKEALMGGPVLELKEGYAVVTFDWNTSGIEAETRNWALKRMQVPGPNGPETIETKQERAEGEQKLTAAAAELQHKCGATISVTYQLPSEKAKPAKPAGQGSLYCKGVVEGLAAACEGDGKKAVVPKKVRAVICRYVEGASKSNANGGAVLRLKGGATIEASYDWNSTNIDSEARKWVKKNL